MDAGTEGQMVPRSGPVDDEALGVVDDLLVPVPQRADEVAGRARVHAA